MQNKLHGEDISFGPVKQEEGSYHRKTKLGKVRKELRIRNRRNIGSM